jgi:fumarate hydratase class II
LSGHLRTLAVALMKISNDLRWMNSGPLAGLGEISLPALQPGSSIMPGKVNPVMCESMMQVTARVMGNDQTIAFSGATGGQFQLNIMMPIMGHAALESVELLASATRAFVDFCAIEMEANPEACEASVEKSLSMVTSLNPHIGYERAAALAKEAFKSGKTIRDLCRDQGILPDSTLKTALDPWSMTEPHE